jgi:hypothetical protein
MIAGFLSKRKNVLPAFYTVYSFGSHLDRNFGEIVFREDGTIYGYQNPHENKWRVDGDELCFLDVDGAITSRFHCLGNNAYLGVSILDRTPLYLLPLLDVHYEKSNENNGKSFLINSIPKAGTYFLESALNAIGASSVRLHLGGIDVVDDYRKVDDSHIHVNPEEVRLKCPVELVTSVLYGRTVVGHLYDPIVLDKIKKQGVHILTIKRNLRDVLVSMYRFKLNKVQPKNELDHCWRTISNENQFLSFLFVFNDPEIELIRNVAIYILESNEDFILSYEEMYEARFNDRLTEKLEVISSGFPAHLEGALKNTLGKSNPTFSGKRTCWRDVWSPDAEHWFEASGLKYLNEKLGYY